ncbi:MAG: polysaccharide deacetylase family protein [Omnitrophica bacterium]|nr:polysaccharide deacetylase family protein [Candidatus Omnitrophota bacterium]
MSTKRRGKKSKLFLTLIILLSVIIVFFGKLFLDAIYVPVILMYHSVRGGEKLLEGYDQKLVVDLETFQRQMKFLRDWNYKVIPLADFMEMVKAGERIPRKTVAITFDDGFRDNYLYAYPVLKEYGFPATIFVLINLIGKRNFLTWEDIRRMEKDIISIGSHTLSHAWLPDLDENSLRRELLESKRILERNTGQKVVSLSYPLGAFNERVKSLARESGYIGAVATNPGRKKSKDDPYALKRIRISMSSENMFAFWGETSGYYTFIKEIRDD